VVPWVAVLALVFESVGGGLVAVLVACVFACAFHALAMTEPGLSEVVSLGAGFTGIHGFDVACPSFVPTSFASAFTGAPLASRVIAVARWWAVRTSKQVGESGEPRVR